MTADEFAAIRARLEAYEKPNAIINKMVDAGHYDHDVEYIQRQKRRDARDELEKYAPAYLRVLLDALDAAQQRIATLEGALAEALPLIEDNVSDEYMCDLCGAKLAHGGQHTPDCLITRLRALKGPTDDAETD